MATVTPTAADRKPEHIDWTTGETVYTDEPDFTAPTREEEREGGEIMATMSLDSFLPRNPSFKCFLSEQARLAAIRDDNANWKWLAALLTDHAARAMFTGSRTPAQYEERREVMSGAADALAAIAWIRRVAGMLESPFKSIAPELERSAATLERFVKTAV